MKRVEINCHGIKNAPETIRAAGFKILPSLNYPSEIHIEADSVDESALEKLLTTLGKSTYQEIIDGERDVVAVERTPLMMFNATKLTVKKHKGKIVAATAAAAAIGSALYWAL